MAGLRAVGPGERATRQRHTVESAAEDGDELDLLYALRRRIAKAISDEDCPKRDLAALSKRLEDVQARVKVLEASEKEEGRDGPVEDEAFDASAV